MRVVDWRKSALKQLEASGSPDPGADAKLLSWGDAWRELPCEEEAHLNALLKRRLTGEPVQYVLASAWFMGLEFYVDERVLIPRQDTETLVERALFMLKPLEHPRVLDLCTGSGAIGLSIAKLCPKAQVTLADISADALDVVMKNRAQLHVSAEVLQGDLFSPVAGREFDMILCNPPYVRRGDLATLQPEVLLEPKLALDGGVDGLDFYRLLANEFRKYLSKDGTIILEIGCDQAADIKLLFGGGEVLKDLSGLDRAIVVRE